MIVKFDDNEYTLDIDDMDLTESRYIKRKTGMGLMELRQGMGMVQPDAMAALYWLMLKQNGGKVTDIERLNFKIVKFGEAVLAAVLAENEDLEVCETCGQMLPLEEDEADPKEPNS